VFDRSHIFNTSLSAVTVGLCITVSFYSSPANFNADDSAAWYGAQCYSLLLCTVASLLVYRLTRAVPWAGITFALTFIFMGSLVTEPGRTQQFIALTTILVPLAMCYPDDERNSLPWVIVGVLTAIIFYAAFNAGLFAMSAAAVVLVAYFPVNRWQGLLAALATLISTLFPFVLMLPLLAKQNALPFAAITALATGAAAIISFSLADRQKKGKRAGMFFLLGIAGATSGVLILTGPIGLTPGDISASLLSYSASQLEFYHYFRAYSGVQVTLAGISMACALRFYYATRVRWILVLGKSYFVSVALYSILINDFENAHTLLGYAGPWCWLVATGGGAQNMVVARLLLATTAAWSPLLAYPIPASQLYFGSLPILLAATVCAADILSGARERTNSLVVEKGIPFAASLAVLLALLFQLSESRAQFYRYKSGELPGPYSSIISIKSRENLYASPGQRADK